MNLAAVLTYLSLAAFVVVTVVDCVVLVWDARLWATDQLTVSHQVWARPVLMVPLVGWQLLGALGLASHFLIRPY